MTEREFSWLTVPDYSHCCKDIKAGPQIITATVTSREDKRVAPCLLVLLALNLLLYNLGPSPCMVPRTTGLADWDGG